MSQIITFTHARSELERHRLSLLPFRQVFPLQKSRSQRIGHVQEFDNAAKPTQAMTCYNTFMTTEALLGYLIQHHTENPGGDEEAMCKFLHQELTTRGASEVKISTVPRTNNQGVGAYVFARFGSPQLLINVHIDTVPANTGWTQDPWTPTITNDKVIGLGAADTKGAIAAILTALEAVVPRNVGLLFSGDEERGTSCIKAFVASPQTKGIERAIVCEPTNRYAGVRHRGSEWVSSPLSGGGGAFIQRRSHAQAGGHARTPCRRT